ncbi:MAG: fibronectin type III domain-containing protein [Spirochaetaceae bacterium]|jgi:hypothetical protein|nr:fibronectin type III domain-containing protein [Spirochaetaceae bacterium]
MQKKKNTASGLAKLLIALAAATAILFVGIGCPTSSDDGGTPNYGEGGLPPEKPYTTEVQTGFELKDSVNLNTVTDAIANTLTNQSAVISFTWGGEGALSYKVYQSEENAKPGSPVATLESTAYFARNLDPETPYYFWIEAVNPNGSTVSDVITRTTGKAGPEASGGLERGNYATNIRIVPGNGSLTVSWDLSHRVGWYEVYYAPVGTVQHLDIYTPLRFRYDSGKTLLSGAVDFSGLTNASSIAYVPTGDTSGHTNAVYPLLSPLTNGSWNGYEVKDGADAIADDGRPQIGTDNALLTGKFVAIGEIYKSQPLRDPYKKLDTAFAHATPWTGTAKGTDGTSVKFFGTSTTITGLIDGTEYEVWIRSPNANGERGYSYAVGTPGASGVLAAPSNVQVTAPAGEYGTLEVTWTAVPTADKYRVYTSRYDYTPNATASYTEAAGTATSASVPGLLSNTAYNVWVVAEKGGAAGAFGTPVSGTTIPAPTSGSFAKDKKVVGTEAKVKTAVYIEVNDNNPLNAGSYILEDGTYLFDYVVLFAANIRNRNCAIDNGDGCTESGPHVHFNPNVRHILSNRDKYIKPLQDKGIKVLLGLLGDHDGIGFGTMNDADRATFIADLKKDVEEYNLDGVDFDDEWASKEDWDGWGNKLPVGTAGKTYNIISPNSIWTYPKTSWSNPTKVDVYRNPSKGIEAGNGQFEAPDQAVMDNLWKPNGESYYKTILAARAALPNKIISLYEFNSGRQITPNGAQNGDATKTGLEGAIDFALQPWYNEYLENSANALSHSIYSPFGMDVGGNAYYQGGSPLPPIVVDGNEQASSTVTSYATKFKEAATTGANPYGMLFFYALKPARDLLKYDRNSNRATVTKEAYISRMTSIVFGQKTLVTADGGNYTKDW